MLVVRLVLALALLLVPCGAAAAPAGRPNLLLISIDTLRADHLGAYGYARDTSPHLDRLAAGGVLYEHAWAQSPWTLPSHASLLTGLYTRGHGLRDDGDRLSRDVPVLSGLLSRAGYRVGALVGSHYLMPRTGLVRVVERFRYFPFQDERGRRAFTADEQVEAAIRFVSADDPRPFFLLLHNYDVHSDYAPSEALRARFARPYDGPLDGTTRTLLRVRRGEIEPSPADVAHVVDLYDAAIRRLDASLGRLLEHLEESGLASETVVVVTSDHGEEFLDHGDVLHGRTLYEEMLHVPLIWRGPGVPSGRRIATPTPLVDVAPTLLALAGVEPPPDLDGRDLRAGWRREAPAAPRPIFAEVDPRRLARTPSEALTAVRVGPLKLVLDRGRERSRLFDLAADPDERTDLAPARPGDARRLAEHVRSHRERSPDARAESAPVSAEERELLRRLGYAD